MNKINSLKHNKYGFTLVELIAVIIIISVIATLGFMSVATIKNKVNEQEYYNLAATIEAAAQGYAEETGVNKMFVQTLIDKGLVEADDETKQVYDPRNSKSLNCQVVKYENGEATLEEASNPSCDVELLSDDAIKIKYRFESEDISAAKDLPGEYWFKDTIVLSVEKTGLINVDLTNAEYKWSSPLAPDRVQTTKELKVEDRFVNDTFQVTLTIGGKKYTAYGKVKIDKEPPKVYNFIDISPEDWSPNKTFQFELSDGESGIQGYQITLNNTTKPSKWEKVEPSGQKSANIKAENIDLSEMNENEYVYVWAIDMVGNTNVTKLEANSDGALQISNIDTAAGDKLLELEHSPKLPEYTRVATLKGKAQDAKSGLVAYTFSKTKLTKEDANKEGLWVNIDRTNDEIESIKEDADFAIANGIYYYCVKDYVGNVNCAENEVDNIDRVIDMANLTLASSSTEWNTYATLKIEAQDKLSKIKRYYISTSSNSPVGGEWIEVGEEEFLDTTAAVYNNTTYYLLVEDVAGNNNYTEGQTPPSVKVNRVDRKGPELSGGGSVSCGNISRTSWNDDVGVDSLYYAISSSSSSSSSSRPADYSFSNSVSLSGNTSFTCNREPCGKYYHVWIKAIDKLGNVSYNDIGSYYTYRCCNEGTYSYYRCSSDGYKVYRRYNECIGGYEEEERYEGCQGSLSYSEPWSACDSYGNRYRNNYYYYLGNAYGTSYYEYGACSTPTTCGGWSACDGYYRYQTCSYYYGGSYQSYENTEYCYVEPSPPESTCNVSYAEQMIYCNDLGLPYDGWKWINWGGGGYDGWYNDIEGGYCYTTSSWNYTACNAGSGFKYICFGCPHIDGCTANHAGRDCYYYG